MAFQSSCQGFAGAEPVGRRVCPWYKAMITSTRRCCNLSATLAESRCSSGPSSGPIFVALTPFSFSGYLSRPLRDHSAMSQERKLQRAYGCHSVPQGPRPRRRPMPHCRPQRRRLHPARAFLPALVSLLLSCSTGDNALAPGGTSEEEARAFADHTSKAVSPMSATVGQWSSSFPWVNVAVHLSSAAGWPGTQFWTAQRRNPAGLGPVQRILHRNSQPLAALLRRHDLPARWEAACRRWAHCRCIGPSELQRVRLQHQFLDAGPGYGAGSLVPDGDDACRR